MATTFGAIGQGNGTLTITRPAVSSGQLLTAIVYGLFSDAAIAPPSGWTAVGNTGTTNNDRPGFFVYTKVAGGSEPATYSWGFSGAANGQHHANGVIAVTTDADTVTPVNVVGTPRLDAGGSTANITITGVTTTAPTLLLAMVGDGADTYTTHTFTPPAGFTEVIEGANTSWGGGAFAIFTKDQPTAGATGNFTATRSANYFGNRSWMVAIALAGGGGDATAPTLTSPTGTQTGSSTATGTVSTNEGDGTLYRLASTNATETAATVKAAALTQAVTATGVQNVTFSGLTASTTYYAHYVHRDAAGNDSAVASSASFTTAAAGDVTPPTLSAPSATATGTSTATGSVTTNEANGTLYRYASTNASESAATIKAAALTQAVSSTGAQAVSFTGLSSGVTYYAHFVHRDAAGNDSAVASSASFTTTAPTATLTVPVVNNTNTSLPSTTLPRVTVDRLSDGVQLLNLASQATNSGGNLVLTSASLTAGVDYMVSAWNADGSLAMIVKATAA